MTRTKKKTGSTFKAAKAKAKKKAARKKSSKKKVAKKKAAKVKAPSKEDLAKDLAANQQKYQEALAYYNQVVESAPNGDQVDTTILTRTAAEINIVGAKVNLLAGRVNELAKALSQFDSQAQ